MNNCIERFPAALPPSGLRRIVCFPVVQCSATPGQRLPWHPYDKSTPSLGESRVGCGVTFVGASLWPRGGGTGEAIGAAIGLFHSGFLPNALTQKCSMYALCMLRQTLLFPSGVGHVGCRTCPPRYSWRGLTLSPVTRTAGRNFRCGLVAAFRRALCTSHPGATCPGPGVSFLLSMLSYQCLGPRFSIGFVRDV